MLFHTVLHLFCPPAALCMQGRSCSGLGVGCRGSLGTPPERRLGKPRRLRTDPAVPSAPGSARTVSDTELNPPRAAVSTGVGAGRLQGPRLAAGGAEGAAACSSCTSQLFPGFSFCPAGLELARGCGESHRRPLPRKTGEKQPRRGFYILQ